MIPSKLQNRTFYHGDNLPFLRAIADQSIHLIATDPPFNKGRNFGEAFRDRWSWERDLRDAWIDDIKGNCPALWAVIATARQTADESMGAYLCWLGIRLLELHRVLRDDGSLYLHIDHSAQAYVKLALDAIFGLHNFRNEIVWYYKTGGTSKRWFGRKHDTILFYSKSDAYTFHPQQEKSYLSHKYGFSNISLDEDEKGVYRMAALRDVWDIPAPARQSSGSDRLSHAKAAGAIRAHHPGVERGRRYRARSFLRQWQHACRRRAPGAALAGGGSMGRRL